MHSAKRSIASTRAPSPNKKFSIIIPAAGRGNRMASYGPKSLIKIKNETLIKRQLRLINKVFADYEIILVTGFYAEKVMDNTPDSIIKIENERYATSNVLRSISIGLRAATTDHVVILYGAVVFNLDGLRAPFDRDSMAILCSTMTDDEIGCISTGGCIENFFYDLPDKWGQIVYLTGEELRTMKRIAYNKDKDNLFGFEALNSIINSGGKIKAYKNPKAKILDIDSSKDIEKAQLML